MIYSITSKTHGNFKILVDKVDYFKLQKLGGKWCAVKKRGMFYFQKRINHKIIELQRWLMTPKKGEYVDHINGNHLDNRQINLRICSNAANLRNGKKRINNTSGHIGVSWDRTRNKWSAKIKVMYKQKFLGRFKDINDAIRARKDAEIKYWSI